LQHGGSYALEVLATKRQAADDLGWQFLAQVNSASEIFPYLMIPAARI
jgi:hypothetical protein